jgi:hypothetical protein
MTISVAVTESMQVVPHGPATLTRQLWTATCQVDSVNYGQSASSYFGALAGLAQVMLSARVADSPIAATFNGNLVTSPGFRNIAAPASF